MSTFSTYLVVVQYRVCFVCKVKDVVQIKYNEPTHVIDKHMPSKSAATGQKENQNYDYEHLH